MIAASRLILMFLKRQITSASRSHKPLNTTIAKTPQPRWPELQKKSFTTHPTFRNKGFPRPDSITRFD